MLLTGKFKINDSASHRHKDENGYLYIKDNPIAKAGVFDYLGREMPEIKGLEPNKIYKVCRTIENLAKNKDLFLQKPIKWDHVWVGKDGDTNSVDGAITGDIKVDGNFLVSDLVIYNSELIEKIEAGEIVEISPAYFCQTIPKKGNYDGVAYEFMQDLASVNHIAIVEQGRSGSDLKILDSKPQNKEIMKMHTKLQNLVNLFKGLGAKIDSVCNDEASKEELVKQFNELSERPANEFEGGAEEKRGLLMELSAKIAKLEETTDDDPTDGEKQDDDPSAGEPKDKQDGEGEGDQNQKQDDDDDDDDDKANAGEKMDSKAVAKLIDQKVSAKLDSFITQLTGALAKSNSEREQAYKEVSQALGMQFDSANKSVNEIYQFGFETITGKTLGKISDAKTAFDTALMLKNASAQNTTRANTAKKQDAGNDRMDQLLNLYRK